MTPADDDEELVLAKLEDAMTPGFGPELDPEEAELVGAFEEDAIELEEAIDSAGDPSDLGREITP